MSKPPYTITEIAADYLAKIAEMVTRLEFGTEFRRNIMLHRKNRIRTIYSSLAIENNGLTIEQVTDVINGKLVAGKQAEIKEVENAYAAYDRILSFDPFNTDDFLNAHKLMTDGLIADAGRFRSKDVGVFSGETVIHMGARPQYVPELIADLFEWGKSSELHPLLKSAIMHFEIETIHPFADGNGRLGRLWQTLILSKWNEIFAWIPMESVIYAKRQDYYDAISASRLADDSGKFIEFTLSALYASIVDQIEKQAYDQQIRTGLNVGDSVNDNVNDSVNDSVNEQIIEMLRQNGNITASQIAAGIHKSVPTVNRRLRQLRIEGYITRIGSDKKGRWVTKN